MLERFGMIAYKYCYIVDQIHHLKKLIYITTANSNKTLIHYINWSHHKIMLFLITQSLNFSHRKPTTIYNQASYY